MTYEQLDLIADSYVPLLWLFCLSYLVVQYVKYKQTAILVKFFSLPIIVYGLMALDNALGIWPYWELDYSTHGAAALAGCYFLFEIRKTRIFVAISLLAYFGLMLYQEYHSMADLVSTSTVLVIAFLTLHIALKKLVRAKVQN